MQPFLTDDRAITSSTQDVLGRAAFARAIANAVTGWRGRDSLVMAVQGPWGSGKTSIKNLVLEALAPDSAVSVLEFNPWEWPKSEQVHGAFFKDLAKVLGRADRSKAGRERAQNLKRYATCLGVLNVQPDFTKAATAVLAVLAAVNVQAWFTLPGWLNTTFKIAGLFGLAAVAVATFARGALTWFADLFNARADAADKTAGELRTELQGSLRRLDRTVLVILDDVDRLTGPERRSLFQLVKVNADFPNLVFVLFSDQGVVREGIGESTPGDADRYLEKIVQVSFPVPISTQRDVDRAVLERVEQLFKAGASARRSNGYEIPNAYAGPAREYFGDLRAAKRYVANLAFSTAVFGGEAFEVSPRDLLLVEVLRVFGPEVYGAVARAKDTFTGYGSTHQEEGVKARIARVLERAKHPDRVANILKVLFPTRAGQFPGPQGRFGSASHGPDFDEQFFREGRVCHADLFDRYFQLVVTPEDLPQAELEWALATTGDRAARRYFFLHFEAEGRLGLLLDRLGSYRTQVSRADAVPCLTALFDVGDGLPDPVGRWGQTPRAHARVVALGDLKGVVRTAAKRLAVLQEAIQATTGLFLPVETVNLLKKDEHLRLRENSNINHNASGAVSLLDRIANL